MAPRILPWSTGERTHAEDVSDGLHEAIGPRTGPWPTPPRLRRARRGPRARQAEDAGPPASRPLPEPPGPACTAGPLPPEPRPPRHGGDPPCPAPPSPRTSSSHPSARAARPPAVTGPSTGCSRAPAATSSSRSQEERGRRGPRPRPERLPGPSGAPGSSPQEPPRPGTVGVPPQDCPPAVTWPSSDRGHPQCREPVRRPRRGRSPERGPRRPIAGVHAAHDHHDVATGILVPSLATDTRVHQPRLPPPPSHP